MLFRVGIHTAVCPRRPKKDKEVSNSRVDRAILGPYHLINSPYHYYYVLLIIYSISKIASVVVLHIIHIHIPDNDLSLAIF